MSTIDEYLEGQPPAQREALAAVRDTVREVVPGAEEGRSYGVPAFLVGGRPLLGFSAAKAHLSLVPFSPAADVPLRAVTARRRAPAAGRGRGRRPRRAAPAARA